MTQTLFLIFIWTIIAIVIGFAIYSKIDGNRRQRDLAGAKRSNGLATMTITACEQDIAEAQKTLGLLLTDWCFQVSSDTFVNQISGNGKFVSEALIPRLRFSFLIANSFLVIIAANEALKEHARWTIDAFQQAFLAAVKEKYKTPAIIGDFICSKAEMAELVSVMRPPDGVNLASTTINLSDLIGIVQEMRMNPAISLYGRGSVAFGSGKMGPFAYLFVRQLLGDDAVADAGQVPNQVLVQWFSSVFQTTLEGAHDLLARGLPNTVSARSDRILDQR